jgi:hypothetical protein
LLSPPIYFRLGDGNGHFPRTVFVFDVFHLSFLVSLKKAISKARGYNLPDGNEKEHHERGKQKGAIRLGSPP